MVRLQGVRRGARARTTRCSSTGATATGRSTWPRDGAEVLRVATRPPVVLEGRRPRRLRRRDLGRQRARPAGGRAPTLDLARRLGGAARRGATTLRVTLRRIETHDVIGAGTTLGVEDTKRHGRPVGRARPVARRHRRSRRRLLHGRRRTCRGRRGAQLAESWSGADGRRRGDLDLTIPIDGPRRRPLDAGRRGRRACAGGADDPLPAVRAARASAPAPYASLPDADALQRRRPRAAPLAVRRDVGARAAADARVRDAVRVRASRSTATCRTASPTTRRPTRSRRAARRSTASCSTPRAATASTSPARWRCCCAWAGSRRAS